MSPSLGTHLSSPILSFYSAVQPSLAFLSDIDPLSGPISSGLFRASCTTDDTSPKCVKHAAG
ncbi:hypothetical protein BDV93DRAFT_524248 [Ceratobasidium sp. AG-I]|nr:hypothetical protein BDV93DRAFT_524248 [Ceratobasidium sp. AG-I]